MGDKCIGFKDGMAVYVSESALAQKGLAHCKEALGLEKRWPVVTNLSGYVVMVKGETHEAAIQRYLNRVEPEVKP